MGVRRWPAVGAFNIRRTPIQGELGVLDQFPDSQNLKLQADPPSAAGPCPKLSKSDTKSTTFLTSQNERNKITKRETMEGLRGSLKDTLMPFE